MHDVGLGWVRFGWVGIGKLALVVGYGNGPASISGLHCSTLVCITS